MFYVHIYGDLEFETREKRDDAFKTIATFLRKHGFSANDVDFQAREDKEFVAADGSVLTSLATVKVEGAELAPIEE